jgi:hypothetical protein
MALSSARRSPIGRRHPIAFTAALAALAAAVAVVAVAVVVSVGAAGRGATEPHRHPSGLWVVPGVEAGDGVPPKLDEQYSAYDLLGEAFPSDFGYVHAENGTLVVDAASDTGAGLAAAMSEGKPLPAVDPGIDPYHKMKDQLQVKSHKARGKPVVVRRVTQSRTDLERIQNGVIDLARDPALADADISETSVDRATGRVVVRLAKLTDAAAAAIVDAYGKDLVVVVEQDNPDIERGPA